MATLLDYLWSIFEHDDCRIEEILMPVSETLCPEPGDPEFPVDKYPIPPELEDELNEVNFKIIALEKQLKGLRKDIINRIIEHFQTSPQAQAYLEQQKEYQYELNQLEEEFELLQQDPRRREIEERISELKEILAEQN